VTPQPAKPFLATAEKERLFRQSSRRITVSTHNLVLSAALTTEQRRMLIRVTAYPLTERVIKWLSQGTSDKTETRTQVS